MIMSNITVRTNYIEDASKLLSDKIKIKDEVFSQI